MQRAFQLELKSLTEAGEFAGMASVYGVVDEGSDSVQPGAFSRTIAASKSRPLLWQHRDPIGTVELFDSPTALMVTGKLSLGIQQAKDAYTLMKDGVVKGLSIGFETVKADYVGEVRRLLELKLWEISLVTFPMNPAAVITGVKSIDHNKIELALKSFRDDILRELKKGIL